MSLSTWAQQLEAILCDSLNQKDIWQTAGFINPEFKQLKPAPGTYFTHEFELNMVIFRKTGWTEKDVLNQISKATHIFKQCGINISPIKMILTDAPQNKIDINYNIREDDHMARLTPLTKKPVVYFIRSNIEGQLAYSWDASIEPPGSPRLNTVWITRNKNPKQNVLAHELGHKLFK